MSQFWSAVTCGLTPYVPGEQPRVANLIKLNTNEHPYGPSSAALAAIHAATDDNLRLYPDPDAVALRAALAARHGLAPEQVFVGNGSDEVLSFAFLGLLKHDLPLWMPDVTYSFYPVYCKLYDITWREIALDADLRIVVDDYLPQGDKRAGAIIFPNPNAPTGRLLPLSGIERIVAANPEAPVVVDEAYIDFAGEGASAVGLIDRYPNLLVVHTFSKGRALAGLRIGAAFGQPALITALARIKDSFNSYPLDRLALAGALASVKDEAWLQTSVKKVVDTRQALVQALENLGFSVLPSAANFIFVRHPQRDAQQLSASLRERAIITRHFKSDRIDQYLRITIGTDAQCATLVEALLEILQGPGTGLSG